MPTVAEQRLPVGPSDGTDDEPAAVTKSIAGRYKQATAGRRRRSWTSSVRLRAGTVTMSIRRWAGAGPEGRAGASAAGSQVWAGRRGQSAVLLGEVGAPTGKRPAS